MMESLLSANYGCEHTWGAVGMHGYDGTRTVASSVYISHNRQNGRGP